MDMKKGKKRKGIADQISEIVKDAIARKLKEQEAEKKGSKAGILKGNPHNGLKKSGY